MQLSGHGAGSIFIRRRIVDFSLNFVMITVVR